MTPVMDPPESARASAKPDPGARPTPLPSLCPYLATPDGTWRSASAVRNHRCTAVAPPVQLATEKQRRLCLVAAHVGCATYTAAVAAQATVARRSRTPSRPVARMTPVILDRGRLDLRLPVVRADRAAGQVTLVAVLAIALVAILLARPSGDSTGQAPGGSPAGTTIAAGGGQPTEAVAASASPAATGSPSPAPTTAPESTGEPTSAPSAVASASAEPAASEPVTSGATYRVKSGDTLSAIAARFGTTTRVLVQLNGISDPSKLKIGQILKLP